MITKTCIAPVNIAVIKYWGKRDEDLILPVNDSLSGTLSMDQLCAKTTIAASPDFTDNKLWLNGDEVSLENNKRFINCYENVRRLAEKKKGNEEVLKWKVHICSENNFPTAAGLASSAAGYACLVYSLASLYGVEKEELSAIARMGSGSACRSIFGGWVQWMKGIRDDGSDSVAVQVAPHTHWPEVQVIILVVRDEKKKVSSTNGMQRSVVSSDLMSHRIRFCAPIRTKQMQMAIRDKDFKTFAEVTMKDSNQFHAICLDTFPPFVYMTEVSHSIIQFVHKYNEAIGEVKVAYTFDAGPNACIYILKDEVQRFLSAVNYLYPSDNHPAEYWKGLPVTIPKLDNKLQSKLNIEPYEKNSLKYVIYTGIGEGPKQLPDSESLLTNDGQPKRKN